MTPVPLTLPFRASEATEVANLVFELAERRPLTDEIRNRIAARLAPLRLETLKPYMGSLARDPVHHSTYYVAVDAGDSPQLLHMALATAPTSSVFHKPLLIGRMRRTGGPEIVINAIPFGPSDRETLDKFVNVVDSGLLPRPLGARGAMVAVPPEPKTGIAAAFEVFRKTLKRTGKNLAAIEMASEAYNAGLYAAVRAGWREGYSAGVVIRAEETGKETIREAARFTRYRIDATGLVADQGGSAGTDRAVEERFEAVLTAEERGWIFDEFVRSFDVGGVVYELTPAESMRMALRLGPALKACEQVHQWIREARSAVKAGKSFDFELALPGASAKELVFCLQWLKAREHALQSIDAGPIADAELEATLREFSGVARHFGCLMTVDSGKSRTEQALEAIARATLGRANYRITGGSGGAAEYMQYVSRIADVLAG